MSDDKGRDVRIGERISRGGVSAQTKTAAIATDFEAPFVEGAVIVQEWRGEKAGDQFGWIARNIGDVDGDGINDVTTSAPTKTHRGRNAGCVYTYSGKTGELLWTHNGKSGFQLGMGIEAAGDTNGDGVPDVIAGAPGGNRALVFSGRTGEVLLRLLSPQPGENFGGKVSDFGDINGDGCDEVIVGASGNDSAVGKNVGCVYIFSGKDGALLHTLGGERAQDGFGSSANGRVIGKSTYLVVGAPNAGENKRGRTYVYKNGFEDPSFVIEADETGSQLGAMFVSVVGDVNGDKIPDVYASDWANNAKGNQTGRVYVHSGKDGKRLHTFTGETAGDGFGIGSADAGDVNHDGCDDLVVGAWQHASGAKSGGKVYLYSGKDGSLMRVWTCKVPGDTFGFDATGMGDVDGDGAIDFLLTSAWSAVSGVKSGRMFILSGKPAH